MRHFRDRPWYRPLGSEEAGFREEGGLFPVTARATLARGGRGRGAGTGMGAAVASPALEVQLKMKFASPMP